MNTVNQVDLENKVKSMYRDVALNPEGEFHFEMGRTLAERLGYPPADLDRIPTDAVASFAGVGYYFGLHDVDEGDDVLDLGSGSGTDAFIASVRVGSTGSVTGVDMTREQLEKATRLRDQAGFTNVRFVESHLEELPFEDGTFDKVISNGVLNLCADKLAAFREAFRVLKPGGSLVLSDIVSESQLPESITCNATLWAACIGGALQENTYAGLAEQAGFTVERVQDNPQYQFLSDGAQGATTKYGVKSQSLHARKPES